jgi:hypothetical protein
MQPFSSALLPFFLRFSLNFQFGWG